jgi:hypothetical protein
MLIKLEDGNTRPKHSSSVLTDASTLSKIHDWREELDSFYGTMQTFPSLRIDEILVTLSSFSARMNYIRTQIVRSENRMMGSFRTKEIDPFIEECDRQFKIFSRLMSLQSMEYDMLRGQ